MPPRGRDRKWVPQAGAIAYRIRDGTIEILLVNPSDDTEVWIFPKGHIEPGERAHDAAVRELREEAGIVGTVVDPVCPPLRFRSRGKRVEVQYFVVAETAETGPGDGRQQRWIPIDDVEDALTHLDAQLLFRAARPFIRGSWYPVADTEDANDPALHSLLLAEYEHVAESLLRNEDDGERRVRFFLSLSGAAAGVVVLIRGDTPGVMRPDRIDPLLVALAVVVAAIGYLTFLRVVERNIASERYKRGLDRIRRAFVRRADDSGLRYLAFDPYDSPCRRRPSWRSFGKGGWLETVSLVEALLSGALAALVVPTAVWWPKILLGVTVGVAAWILLMEGAANRYAGQSWAFRIRRLAWRGGRTVQR